MKTLTNLVLLLGVVANASLSMNSAHAQGICVGKSCEPKQIKGMLGETRELLWKLSNQPALMNIEYLKFFLGRPENERHQRGNPTKHYYWYDEKRRPIYELKQTEIAPGQVVDSTFTANLGTTSAITVDVVEKIWDLPSKKFFDQDGHACQAFSFAPNTLLAFSAPPNTFTVSRARVMYQGPPLPPVPVAESAEAEEKLLARTMAAGSTELSTEETLPLLRARLKTKPLDAETHFMLAQALVRQNQVHEAIGEYKVALALSGDNQAIREQSLQALRAMHVIDDSRQPDRRKFKLVQNGQRIRTDGPEEKKKNKNRHSNSTAAAAGDEG